jgi:hypothetical protein
MCFAPLSNWGVIFVDAEDAKFLLEHVWSQNATYRYRTQYAVSPTFARQNNASRYLHLAVFGIKQNVAHINRNGLDNRRANLRLSTETESCQGRRKRKSNLHRPNLRSSHYKGAYKYHRNWMAYITVRGKKIWLGRFGFESDAAICYNYHAVHYFGDFAGPNDLTSIDYMHD